MLMSINTVLICCFPWKVSFFDKCTKSTFSNFIYLSCISWDLFKQEKCSFEKITNVKISPLIDSKCSFIKSYSAIYFIDSLFLQWILKLSKYCWNSFMLISGCDRFRDCWRVPSVLLKVDHPRKWRNTSVSISLMSGSGKRMLVMTTVFHSFFLFLFFFYFCTLYKMCATVCIIIIVVNRI